LGDLCPAAVEVECYEAYADVQRFSRHFVFVDEVSPLAVDRDQA
jgi:hypothetical protein